MSIASMPIVLKAHVSLHVRSIALSVEFYRKLLGIEPMKVKPGYAKFDVQNPPLNLSLLEGARTGRGPLSHLGLQVSSTDDVVAIRNRWSTAGLDARYELQTNCCYAIQDKAWVKDPDGNEWEVFTVLANVEESADCCGTGNTGCCDAPQLVDIVK